MTWLNERFKDIWCGRWYAVPNAPPGVWRSHATADPRINRTQGRYVTPWQVLHPRSGETLPAVCERDAENVAAILNDLRE